MQSKSLEVNVEVGLHARPAMYLTQVASKFRSSVWIEFDGKRVNAKSLLGILSLAVSKGDKVQIFAEGQDENLAVAKLSELILSNFEEKNDYV
jgi:phosphocarrier protein